MALLPLSPKAQSVIGALILLSVVNTSCSFLIAGSPCRKDHRIPQWLLHSKKDPNENNRDGTPNVVASSPSNITIHTDVASFVGVRPFIVVRGQHPLLKKASMFIWKTRRTMLRVLHSRDPLRPQNSCINLECLWYKALVTNDKRSPLYDDGLTADMLPRFSRLVVRRPFLRLYPRLVHGRLEVRSAYLDQAILKEIDGVRSENVTQKIRLVYIGAGYDTRSVKLLSRGIVDECFDLDLPDVMTMKGRLFDSRLRQRRPELRDEDLPTLVGVNLNDIDGFCEKLGAIVAAEDGASWHTIFIAEGVLMYLKEGNARQVLKACAEATESASLCFADRLDNVTDVNGAECQEELAQASWKLVDWAPTPSMNARHIGTARLML